MKEKTIVVLPGSFWQIPLIKKSKAMGYRTLAVNPYPDSPAFSFADGHLQSDIFDIERVTEYCKSERADAVISDECDIAMPVVAKLGRELCLNTLNEESAHLFTNKQAMRDFCIKHKIPSPEYRLCKTAGDAETFFENMRGRIIIKPLDSNSSRGVFTIEAKEDIPKHFEESLSYSRNQKAILAERYIEGTEFTADGIKTPERHFTLAISEKKHYKHNPNVASELYFTRENEKFDYSMLEAQNDFLINHSPLQFGLTHTEYKYENGRFYLIETAARGGGNLISSHIVPFLSGIDNYRYLLNCCTGNVTSPEFIIKNSYKTRSAVLRFFDVPKQSGAVERIEGREVLEHDPRIAAYRFNFQTGDRLSDAATDADRIGFYIACCDTKKELDELMKNIQRDVRIICNEDRKA